MKNANIQIKMLVSILSSIFIIVIQTFPIINPDLVSDFLLSIQSAQSKYSEIQQQQLVDGITHIDFSIILIGISIGIIWVVISYCVSIEHPYDIFRWKSLWRLLLVIAGVLAFVFTYIEIKNLPERQPGHDVIINIIFILSSMWGFWLTTLLLTRRTLSAAVGLSSLRFLLGTLFGGRPQ